MAPLKNRSRPMRRALAVCIAGLAWIAPLGVAAEDATSTAARELLGRADQMQLLLDGAARSADEAAAQAEVSVPQAAQLQLKDIGKQLAKDPGIASELQSKWSSFVAEEALRGGAVDINALVQFVLRESYLQSSEDLRFFAEKVKNYNALKKSVRDEVRRLRDFDVKVKSGAHAVPLIPDPNLVRLGVIGGGSAIETSAQARAYIGNLEQTLNQIGDDAQLANVDLQNTLQQQQQTLQMASNIAKMLHDTAQGVISRLSSPPSAETQPGGDVLAPAPASAETQPRGDVLAPADSDLLKNRQMESQAPPKPPSAPITPMDRLGIEPGPKIGDFLNKTQP
jgi:hypothetical protein